MDSISRNNIIAQVIEEYEAEQKRLQEEKELKEQLALLGGGDEIASPNMTNTSGTSSWYFYNQTSLTRGATEFRNKWGNSSRCNNITITFRKRVKIESPYIPASMTLTLFTLAKSNAAQTKGQFF